MSEKNIDKLLESFVGGVIMDVTTVEEAEIAEGAGAVSLPSEGYPIPVAVTKNQMKGVQSARDYLADLIRAK